MRGWSRGIGVEGHASPRVIQWKGDMTREEFFKLAMKEPVVEAARLMKAYVQQNMDTLGPDFMSEIISWGVIDFCREALASGELSLADRRDRETEYAKLDEFLRRNDGHS